MADSAALLLRGERDRLDTIPSRSKLRRLKGYMDANEIAGRLTFLKGAQTECPICDQTRWANPADGRAILEISRDNEIERLPLIPLICKNCGFVRLIDERRLYD